MPFLETYWASNLQRIKKQNNIEDRSASFNFVNWLSLNNSIIEEKTNISEKKILQLANKRRKIHSDLHLQADEAVVSLLVTSSTGFTSDKVGPSGPSAQLAQSTRQESAERVDQLHKQDLLYYNILDFVATPPDASLKMLLCDKYTTFMEHTKSLDMSPEDITEDVDMLITVDDDNIYKLCDNAVKGFKLMMKHIISQRVNKHFAGLSSVKLYGIQIYKNEMFACSLTNPIVNRYMFALDMKFSLPTAPRLLSQSFPRFIQNVWK
ncbi:hypothetical protein PHYBLDRAFT_150547 [Phycomyces blakesleeanus NRRL 1555(-)]|uniref:Uncharacterized protein n=1 Tax=Phycomyces blakesleeanus (strain ATCC 8743b / DSM 1359 / FGSC 10004 / NBRC 33097 / NRRL 1555) TaxID=763407 RepID=A0A167KLI7_PHYB8|nr:hypothetical protein PHYBLDRAFT_150547 [Phycomyces blakesleeanus NRRL 1555(-)]OAD68367.1 hypothetical protein PHYBLDRAFT_150547 [Phycomyces blakesleeanus NRRL 1555(-)]|eukprot:XP_018286407.1 hypothetical protein PHYBLDRAFT_150547 [Phycomyces blakesleeanus NRRL 1555(-)]